MIQENYDLVIGGAGKLGSRIVNLLLEDGNSVRVLSRRPTLDQRVLAVAGSITDQGVVHYAVRGAKRVVIAVESSTNSDNINGPEAVHLGGVRNVINALGRCHAHVVLVTQIYVTDPDGHPEIAGIIRARAAGEDILRKSGLVYTIVRPSWLTEKAGTKGIELNQGDNREGTVSRDAVAATVVASLNSPFAQRTTFEVYESGGTDEVEWTDAFMVLRKD